MFISNKSGSTKPLIAATHSKPLTNDISKDTFRLISISKSIANYFIEQSATDEYIANHLKCAIQEAEKNIV